MGPGRTSLKTRKDRRGDTLIPLSESVIYRFSISSTGPAAFSLILSGDGVVEEEVVTSECVVCGHRSDQPPPTD